MDFFKSQVRFGSPAASLEWDGDDPGGSSSLGLE